MIKKISLLGTYALILLFFYSYSDAYDHKSTHKIMTRESARRSNLDNYLKGNLEFPSGSEAIVNGQEVLQWLSDGSELEDSPLCRAANHFHDPIKPWDQSQLSDDFWADLLCFSSKPWYSNITWATGYAFRDGGKITPPNQMGWDDARNYYEWALTAISKTDRETYFAKTFQSLGQVSHLLQDMSVPAHVRNDFKSHYLSLGPDQKPLGRKTNQFEHYVKGKPQLFTNASSLPPKFVNPRVTDFWDTNQLTKENPVGLNNDFAGLAELVNANYFSDWTIPNNNPEPQHRFNFPTIINEKSIIYRICEDYAPDSTDITRYISRKECPPLAESRQADHFAAISLVNEENLIKEENISTLKLHLDDNVNFTYANDLIPRAIGYSAKLLDYFFRGRLEVVSIPVLWENSLVQLGLKIKNATPGENMGEGRFALVYRYTPEGGNPDGSNDILGEAWANQDSIYLPIQGLLSGKENEFMFLIPQGAIPLQNLGSVRFTLTFRGKLGNEDGAVIGKVFSPGEVKFNEEWDNGLLGNHTWAHNGLNGPDSNSSWTGQSFNLVEGGVLIKENVRYAGRAGAHYNESFIGVWDLEGEPFRDMFPVPVTNQTFLQFKIDELYSNAAASEGNHCQYFEVKFNQGYKIIYSEQSQFCPYIYDPYREKAAYRTFSVGYGIVDNIFKTFENSGISVPANGFSLTGIMLYQNHWLLPEPSSREHYQSMKVDFIRVVEGSNTEKPPEDPEASR